MGLNLARSDLCAPSRLLRSDLTDARVQSLVDGESEQLAGFARNEEGAVVYSGDGEVDHAKGLSGGIEFSQA